jgi:hypothetical protein
MPPRGSISKFKPLAHTTQAEPVHVSEETSDTEVPSTGDAEQASNLESDSSDTEVEAPAIEHPPSSRHEESESESDFSSDDDEARGPSVDDMPWSVELLRGVNFVFFAGLARAGLVDLGFREDKDEPSLAYKLVVAVVTGLALTIASEATIRLFHWLGQFLQRLNEKIQEVDERTAR